MPEQDKRPDLIKEYLTRLRIQEKSQSFNEYAERLAHLSEVRAILENLSAKGYAASEGPSLLGAPDEPLGTAQWGPPDFVLLREDVLIHVCLVIGPIGVLTSAQLQGIWNDLRENPSLSGVAVCWPERDYPTVAIDSFTIRSLLERPVPVTLTADSLSPLSDAIDTFFRAQLVDWNLSPTSLSFSSGQRIRELGDALRDKIGKTVSSEQSREYEIPEKADALSRVSSSDIQELVETITSLLTKQDASSREFAELEDLIERLRQR